ncbi:MAG: hypothetical protein HY298_23315 [Verrucomicrobia bacterium]|nr:hypothetical protein [Verrucomicrobiota bacterium]
MRKSILLKSVVVGLLLAAVATPTFAEEGGKPVTLNGEGKCAKCALKETDKCQNAIQVEKDGKKTTYYLVQNDVSKKFHENLCKESKKISVTGTCKKVGDKLEVTATKIELAKD